MLCENILKKIPLSLIHTREILMQNHPLTIEKPQLLLENQSRNDITIKIKAEESAMKATSSKADKSEFKCKNGVLEPSANHTRDQCFKLHPKEKAKYEKR
jgi:hypothetical protein